MSNVTPLAHVAVIGAGLAGAACAASLRQGGLQVSVFDKSRGVGGRMATRRTRWQAADGTEHTAEFDHGAQFFTATSPRFRAAMGRAQAAGVVQHWQRRVHSIFPDVAPRDGWVATPGMPALARHLLTGLPQQLGQGVQRLQRTAAGWTLHFDDGASAGPFDQVVLAIPAAQAAALLAGHHARWARALSAIGMQPCWTLMAVTDDVEWPWDGALPDRGPLAWVGRNDRVPGRHAAAGTAHWVAQATPAWSSQHLEEEAQEVHDALLQALGKVLPGGRLPTVHHSAVHRWRYALPDSAMSEPGACWWDTRRGLGVCGDFMAGGGVEAAWQSGDEMACTLAAALETDEPVPEAVAA